jgi:hypothetical protein
MKSDADPPPKPLIYVLHSFVRWTVEFPLLQNVWIKPKYQLRVYRVTNSADIEYFRVGKYILTVVV